MTGLPVVELFTDGSCRGNPGPGGWAALLRNVDREGTVHEKELSGGDDDTTNNRMELTAAIRGLAALNKPCQVRLHTDSQYVRNGITRWLEGWKAKGWKTSDKKPVKNVELWQELDAVTNRHEVEWVWVKGHDGHAENERVDALAKAAVPGG